jgi:hypothetical protein
MQFIYLIQSQEFFKIGVAQDVRNRLASLQTGNPNELVVISCWEFPNAEIVERCVHQRFDGVRKRGEWFLLTRLDLANFEKICAALGGVRNKDFDRSKANQDEVEEADDFAEDVLETVKESKWDFEKMHADGWYMEKASNGKYTDRYWAWRRGKIPNREYAYGGKIVDLPLPFDEMRRKFKR